ncbi:MAG: hypothetical protein B6D65_00820 [candidate division Zixibacteria bacterium 4484_93]|nr:MAG: hypothetical protein B6D65_00820 [candidate division Zixibacteria bacterium 4484_93]
MKKFVFFLMLVVPLSAWGQCIIEAVDCHWIPPDAREGELITKYLTITNIGDEVCDSVTVRLALASWGLWLDWTEFTEMDVPFIAPGDTITLVIQEMRACNEEHYTVRELLRDPILVDHYDFLEAPADSGVCDSFYVGNPSETETVRIALSVDEFVGTSYDAYISPVVFTLAPGDSQLVHICTGVDPRFDFCDTFTVGSSIGDSMGCVLSGAWGTIRARVDSGGTTPDFGNRLRFARFNRFVSYAGIIEGYGWGDLHNFILEQRAPMDIRTYSSFRDSVSDINIIMDNSSPCENNITWGGLWGVSPLYDVSFRAKTPENFFGLNIDNPVFGRNISIIDGGNTSPVGGAVTVDVEPGSDVNFERLLIRNSNGDALAVKRGSINVVDLVIENCRNGIVLKSGDNNFTNVIFQDVSDAPVLVSGTASANFYETVLSDEDVRITSNGEEGISDLSEYRIRATIGELELDTTVVLSGPKDYIKLRFAGISSVEMENRPNFVGYLELVPNPFNSVCKIKYNLPAGTGKPVILIYNILGEQIDVLDNLPATPGEHTVQWRTDAPSGSYIVRLDVNGSVRQKKLIYLK